MRQLFLDVRRISFQSIRGLVLLAVLGVGAGVGAYLALRANGVGPTVAAAKAPDAPQDATMVRMPETKWPAAGIRIEPAAYGPFTERIWRSGRLALNETRVAHITLMVEGVVREVKVRLGQDVQAGEVLAVIDSREVGQAKLELVKARLATEYARAQHRWTQTTSRYAEELVTAMLGGATVADIEKHFKDRPIGDLRQQLMTAYSRRLQAKAHYEAVLQPGVQSAISGSNVIRLRADCEAAEATFSALCEEVKFQAGQQARACEQKLREAQTAESLCKATLLMLGYLEAEVDALDPIAEGSRVSLYRVRAPFAGTVVEQRAALGERVGPQAEMFEIADLSTLWLRADVPQKDLTLVRELAGGQVRFREAEDAPSHEAAVFYTGDIVDKDTRAVVLSASVPNPNRIFKPGAFVEVELTRPGGAVVQVPIEAVQWQGKQPFVFVHGGGDAFCKVDVRLGRTSAGQVEVRDGLKAGQAVVTAGGFILKSELLKDQMVGE